VTSVLITGAAGDIGSAIATTLAASGRALVLADAPNSDARLNEVLARCRQLGAEAKSCAFDVTDTEAVQAAVDELGPLGGLVNSAGYQGPFAPVQHYPVAEARRMFEVNVLGLMSVISATARIMIAANEGGSIVNLGSMAGVSGAANMPAYSASKAAVIGLTKAAAKDLAPHGIRVNAVSPGFIGPGQMWETQVARQAEADGPYANDPHEVAQQMIGMVPLGRYGSPAEVASVVAFLLSDAASYLTGVNIEVSGGSV
jgi:NAD(P)-dependent dehydrogenase (short-subunit alcohol dehydrogenase family)